MIKFGPSGAGESFYEQGFTKTEQAADWLKDKNIDLFEYSFGRGVNIKDEKAQILKDAFEKANIEISVHAPYYINFANPDDEKAINSVNYVLESAFMARKMGANRIIFHPASQGKEDRTIAVDRTFLRLQNLAEIIKAEGLDDMIFCPETMGKLVQIGTIEEVTRFCQIAPFYVPTVDFGHINAREQGSLKSIEDFKTRIQYMIDKLGFDRIKNFHVHFSKIQYSAKGEVRHLNFDDTIYGPGYEPFIDACIALNVEPHIICESAGNQTEDSMAMKAYYLSKVSL